MLKLYQEQQKGKNTPTNKQVISIVLVVCLEQQVKLLYFDIQQTVTTLHA